MAGTISTGPPKYDESEMLEALHSSVTMRKPALVADTQPLDILSQAVGRENSLGQLWPINSWGVQIAPLLRAVPEDAAYPAGLVVVDIPSDVQDSDGPG